MEKKLFLVVAMMLAGAVCLGGLELYPSGGEVPADGVLDSQLIPIGTLSSPESGIAVPAPADSAWEYFPEDDWGYYFSGCCCESLSFDFIALDDYLFLTSPQTGQEYLVISTDSVPEPATLSLLALGVATLLRKRK